MLLKNASVLLGEELEFIPRTDLIISDQKFKRIHPNLSASSKEEILDCEGLILVPGFVNSHSHIGDSVAKDIIHDGTVDETVHPVFGAKTKILKRTSSSHLASFMKNTCYSMIRKGITTFVDFREGGLNGVNLLKNVLSTIPIRSIILGRMDYYQNRKEIRQNIRLDSENQKELNAILKKCDGIGISGANEFSDSVLRHMSGTSKIRAIHAAETKQSTLASKRLTGISEIRRALLLKPHFLVHMTFASKAELFLVAKKTRGIVVCPRANGALAEGIPDVDLMHKTGCNITLGTDNVMINSPDLFREMDYLWKVSMGIHKKRFDPKQILKMVTVNAGKLLNKDIGTIQCRKFADGIFFEKHEIDLDPMHSAHTSIVHRASESSIRAVMIGGKIIHGKI